MKIANILIGAMALVVLPAIASASIAPGGINGGQGEATRAEQGRVMAFNFCSFWETLNGCITGTRPPLRNERLNQSTRPNSSTRDFPRGQGSGVTTCARGCRYEINPDGPDSCFCPPGRYQP